MNDDSTRIMRPEAPPDAAVGPLGPGVLVANTYEIVRRLGGGGMGEVYLARHASLGTLHAVKVIRPSMAENRQVMDLFYREARVLRTIRHDAVVHYDGFVRDAEGREFLVMEYGEGTALSEHLNGTPCDPADVITLRERLCAGLAEAHRCGAVHRDLSPDNVILPEGRFAEAKLIDFGLAKLTDRGQETIIGDAFAGKYRYAAPEQFGLYGGVVGPQTDIYSLGLVLAAAALGRPLDMGGNFPAAVACRQQVPDLAAVAAPLGDWLTAMLAPDPAERPASIAALLQRWPAATIVAPPADRPPTPAADPSAAATPAPLPAPRRTGLALGLLILAGAGAAGAGLYWVLRPLQPPPLPAPAPSPQSADTRASPPPATPASPAPPPPAPGPAPTPDTSARLPAAVAEVLRAFQCPALKGQRAGAVLTVTGQVRSGDMASLYDRLREVYPGPVDVTAVTTAPWPRCALTEALAAQSPGAAGLAPRIGLNRDRTSFALRDQIDIRIQSQAPRPGRIALTYVDAAGEAFHILPYGGEPDAIAARGTLNLAPVVAEPPAGAALLVATWCPGELYASPPPETEPVDQFVATLGAALGANSACSTGLLDLEIRAR